MASTPLPIGPGLNSELGIVEHTVTPEGRAHGSGRDDGFGVLLRALDTPVDMLVP
jgi:hypothetical protein